MVREPDATMQPTLQDNQLMSKQRVLSLKPQLRLEWRGQDGQNETKQPDHSASLGDSITSSTGIRFSVHTGVEGLPSTRLYEIWFEQKWETALSLRAGQLAADTEFINAKYTDVFTNASLGWPAITSINFPSGGPSPPLAALGARLRANVVDNLTVAAAIFDGDAAGPGPGD